MEKITNKNINKEYPNVPRNEDLIKEKGLEKKYYDLLNKYNAFFTCYLKEKLPLEEIDKNMRESELNFVKIEEDNMDFYQITSTMGLDYIYLRNNLYIEKLNKTDLNFLEKHDEYSGEVSEFISNTFKEVINPYDKSRPMFYGPEIRTFMCNSDNVVIGVRYDEFNNTDLEDEEFTKNFLKKQEIISQLMVVLYVYGMHKLNTSVNMFQYNDVSIINKYKEGSHEK